MTSVRKSLSLSFAETYGRFLLEFGFVIVISRLLTPSEIGVFSVGMAFVALAHVLRDFGIGNYLIQEKELTRDRIRTAFGVTLVMAWTIAALIFLLRGPVAAFYEEMQMADILAVLAINFLVLPFGNPIVALLRRDMNFTAYFWIQIGGTVIRIALSIWLALDGMGPMSLAWGAVAGAVATAIIAMAFRPDLALILPSFKEWRRVARFGGMSSAGFLVSEVGVNAPDMIIGKVLDFASVGIYSRAYSLIRNFNLVFSGAIMKVALPAFAQKLRDGDDIRTPYIHTVQLLTVIAWPAFLFLGAYALPIIRLFFGDQWDAAAPVAQVLCIAAFVSTPAMLSGQVLVASGHVTQNLQIQIVSQGARVGLLLAAAPFGLIYAAASQILVYVVHFSSVQYHFSRLYNLRLRDTLFSALRSLLTTVPLLVPIAVHRAIQPDVGAIGFAELGLAALVYGLVWLLFIYLLRHPICDEIGTLFGVLRKSKLANAINGKRRKPSDAETNGL